MKPRLSVRQRLEMIELITKYLKSKKMLAEAKQSNSYDSEDVYSALAANINLSANELWWYICDHVSELRETLDFVDDKDLGKDEW